MKSKFKRILSSLAFSLALFFFLFYPAGELARWMSQPLWLFRSVAFATLFAIILGAVAVRKFRFPWLSRVSSAVHLAFGFLVSLLLYVLLLKVTDLFLLPHGLDSLRGLLAFVFTFVTLTVGYFQARSTPRVRRVEIAMPLLHPALDGFRIVQISDLHVSSGIRRDFVERVVARVQGLGADLIAFTGDMVDGTVESLRDQVAPLASLRAPYGKYFVPGNHEYYWDAPAWIAEQERLGARALVNKHVVVERGGGQLVIAGVTDFSASHLVPGHASDVRRAFDRSPPHATRILLAHQPVSHRAALRERVHLQLSGHTHGGQWFPAKLLVRLAQRHLRGLYRVREMWLYVSPGTGYWGPPLRFLTASEITLLTLRSPSVENRPSQREEI